MRITLFSGNGAPTAATDGRPLRRGGNGAYRQWEGFDPTVDECSLMYKQSGTGTQTCAYLRVWLYSAALAEWIPAGSGDDADKGKLNASAGTPYALGEVGTDEILHTERIRGLREFERIYIEAGALGGTSPSATCVLEATGDR
jgi:hypothetical protein